MSQLLNIRQLAEFLQCHEKSIYRWMRQDKIPKPLKPFGSPLWDKDEILETLRKQRDGVTSVANGRIR